MKHILLAVTPPSFVCIPPKSDDDPNPKYPPLFYFDDYFPKNTPQSIEIVSRSKKHGLWPNSTKCKTQLIAVGRSIEKHQ